MNQITHLVRDEVIFLLLLLHFGIDLFVLCFISTIDIFKVKYLNRTID